ncbi:MULTISPECIES: YueI family protein [unclassified Lacticaseibacillus]|uniref:YueI family protein n=1 Tax=unclassified Lacticaseibacillus TaxID=2759744 RepID=UPI00194367FD|nr:MULTISPECIES: YueI family protein [unclassified Lacticaseibacillus]
MADDDLQQHLNSSIYGPPQTNPDERRHYLGSLRERVAIRVFNQDVEAPTALSAVTAALAKTAGESGYKLLINGKLDPEMTAPYMQAASTKNVQFTLVNDGTATLAPTGAGILLVARSAINIQDIDLPKTESKSQDTPQPKQKPGFFGRLFK